MSKFEGVEPGPASLGASWQSRHGAKCKNLDAADRAESEPPYPSTPPLTGEEVKPNSFCLHRPAFYSLRERLKTKIPDACVLLMQHLCINANHSPGTYLGIEINRGQIFVGRHTLQQRTLLHQSTLRSSIKLLVSCGELTQQQFPNGTLFTIVNYDTYDGSIDDKKEELTQSSHSTHTVLTPSKEEVKKKKEEKEEITTLAPSGRNGKSRKSDPYIDQLVEIWNTLDIPGDPPYSLFGRWRKVYGDAFVLKELNSLYLRRENFDGKGAAYLGTVLERRHKEHLEANKPRPIMPRRSW